jgi:hypothetical protein
VRSGDGDGAIRHRRLRGIDGQTSDGVHDGHVRRLVTRREGSSLPRSRAPRARCAGPGEGADRADDAMTRGQNAAASTDDVP